MSNRPEVPNPAHALNGGIPLCFHIDPRWPAASDVQRWALAAMRIIFIIVLLAVQVGLE
jgi:hypothetical protein